MEFSIADSVVSYFVKYLILIARLSRLFIFSTSRHSPLPAPPPLPHQSPRILCTGPAYVQQNPGPDFTVVLSHYAIAVFYLIIIMKSGAHQKLACEQHWLTLHHVFSQIHFRNLKKFNISVIRIKEVLNIIGFYVCLLHHTFNQ